MTKKLTKEGREPKRAGICISGTKGKQRLAEVLLGMKPESERIEALSTVSIPKLIQVVRDITRELGFEKLPEAIEMEIIENILLVEPDKRFEILKVMIQRHFDEAAENRTSTLSEDTHPLPGCSMRNPDGNKRSTDLDPETSPDPHETLRLMERRVLACAYREHADDAGAGTELVSDNFPRSAQRTATPSADEYATVGKDNLFVEGRRSIDLDPETSQTPEEQIIQKENEE